LNTPYLIYFWYARSEPGWLSFHFNIFLSTPPRSQKLDGFIQNFKQHHCAYTPCMASSLCSDLLDNVMFTMSSRVVTQTCLKLSTFLSLHATDLYHSCLHVFFFAFSMLRARNRNGQQPHRESTIRRSRN